MATTITKDNNNNKDNNNKSQRAVISLQSERESERERVRALCKPVFISLQNCADFCCCLTGHLLEGITGQKLERPSLPFAIALLYASHAERTKSSATPAGYAESGAEDLD